MKYSWKTIFNAVLIVAAYGYLIYTFATFDGYPALLAHFRSVGWLQLGALALAAALIPLNILCESVKWKYLLRKLEPMSLAEAQRQVYFGFVGAMLTPERIGDYPTRATRIEDKSKWLPAITLGLAGTMALSTVNMVGGLLSLLFSGLQVGQGNQGKVLAISISLLVFFVTISLLLPLIAKRSAKRHPVAEGETPTTWQRVVEVVKDFSPWEYPTLILISLMRYVVYASQLLLVLIFCGVELTPLQYLTIIPIHYLFVTVVPTVPLADAAVRGSVGILIFSTYTSNSAGVAIAAIILWLLNTIVPTIVGTMVKKPANQDSADAGTAL